MNSDRLAARQLRAVLHQAYDDVDPGVQLRTRVHELVGATGQSSSAEVMLDVVDDEPPTRPRLSRRTRYAAAIVSAACLACVLAIVGLLIGHPAGKHAGQATVSLRPLPSDLTLACSSPSSGFAQFWELESMPVDYSGTVRVNQTSVPARSMYISDGRPGAGFLCVTGAAAWNTPIVTAAAPRSGSIAYLASYQNAPFGAVSADVVRVTISEDGAASVQSFTRTNSDPSQSLQGIGGSWSTFDSPYGYAGPVGATSIMLTVRAFNAAGQLVDTATLNVSEEPGPSIPAH